MADPIQAGFTMHPQWVRGASLSEFLHPLWRAGLRAFEFELDSNLDFWEMFQPLMESSFEAGMKLSFHAPYRAPHSIVGFTGKMRAVIQQDYRGMLMIADHWAQRSGEPAVVVFHGAAAAPPQDTAKLFEDTIAFLEWVCGEFPNLRIALENNSPVSEGKVKVGVDHASVLRIVNAVNRPNIGICWDMGHDALKPRLPEITPDWLAGVIHVHVHDIDEVGRDHYPLVWGRVPHQAWLRALKGAGMRGLIVLELKGGQLKDWPPERIETALVGSISAITKEVSLK